MSENNICFYRKFVFTALRAAFIIVVIVEVVLLPKNHKETNRSEKSYTWICIQENSSLFI